MAVQLRREGKVTTPGKPFEASDKAETDALLAGEVALSGMTKGSTAIFACSLPAWYGN